MREFFLGFKYSQLSQGKECESSCSVFDKCGKTEQGMREFLLGFKGRDQDGRGF